MSRDDGEPHRGKALEIAVAAAGILLMAFALLARQSWWDRHFLPVFFFSHAKYVLAEKLVRLAAVLAGFFLVMFAGPMTARKARQMPVRDIAFSILSILVAIGLALVVTELTMRHKFAFAAAETQPDEEPVRQPDRRLGWMFKPDHDGGSVAGERRIAYSIDRLGYRVRSHAAPVDVNRPTVVFTGESIMAGYGLNWDETIPAQTAAVLGLQSASIAVFGYANDQAYLRLASELPRFRRPVAVVSLFIPSLFPRNLGDDRPHLDARLHWAPAVHHLWLTSFFRFAIPYHSEADVEQGVEATRAELLATAALARRHGAIALVVDPQFGPESPVEQMLRRRILEESGVSFIRVPLDPAWHLKGDLHPDARAAHAIALAIVARLRSDLAGDRPDFKGSRVAGAR